MSSSTSSVPCKFAVEECYCSSSTPCIGCLVAPVGHILGLEVADIDIVGAAVIGIAVLAAPGTELAGPDTNVANVDTQVGSFSALAELRPMPCC